MTASSIVEFAMWLLIAASAIAVIALRYRIPYTVALVVGGLALGSLRLPVVESVFQSHRPEWLTPDVILIFFLPALLFEGSIKIRVRHLAENLTPIAILATAGVLVTAGFVGALGHWLIGLPLAVALLFGAMISATDPIAVLAMAKEMAVAKRLTMILEGESLFNDGTAVVLFQILVAAVATQSFHLAAGAGEFLKQVLVGATIGLALGYVASKVTSRIDDPQIEITLTTIVAYGSYLLAHHFGASGVIATVAAGLVVGNLGQKGWSARTRVALWAFWEYATFVINSILFLLIGLEVRVSDLLRDWRGVGLAIGAVLLGRALAVYGLSAVNNRMAQKIPGKWQHVLVWGGLHGALSLALALSLSPGIPYRDRVLTLTFGVVAFSMVVQGISIKGLIRGLGLSTPNDDERDAVRAQQIAISSMRSELDEMARTYLISAPLYEGLRGELDAELAGLRQQTFALYGKHHERAASEMEMARTRLSAAGRTSIEEAVRDGMIASQSGAKTADAIQEQLEQIAEKVLGEKKDAGGA